jgi:DNA repair ATPase RecN
MSIKMSIERHEERLKNRTLTFKRKQKELDNLTKQIEKDKEEIEFLKYQIEEAKKANKNSFDSEKFRVPKKSTKNNEN